MLARWEARLGPAIRVSLLPEGLAAAYRHFSAVQATEAWATLGGWVSATAPQFGPGVGERFAAARAVPAEAAQAGRVFRQAMQARVRPLLAGGAVLAYPTSPGPAPLLTTTAAEQQRVRERTIGVTSIAGFSGLPELSIPAGAVDGAPVGLSPGGRTRRRSRPACAGADARRRIAAMDIRDATEADVPEIQSIYAHHVLHGAGTFEEVPPSVEDMLQRFRAIKERNWSYLVMADATGVVGYAYFNQLRDRSAYRFTCENSIYVREDVRGQGVGKALVSRLLSEAEQAGFRQMIAVIGDSENIGSIGVHTSLGFHRAGLLRASGLKFGAVA